MAFLVFSIIVIILFIMAVIDYHDNPPGGMA